MKENGFVQTVILVGFLTLALVAGGVYYTSQQSGKDIAQNKVNFLLRNKPGSPSSSATMETPAPKPTDRPPPTSFLPMVTENETLTPELAKQIIPLDTSSQVNEMISWKIYKDEKYYYEIKYPDDWKIEEEKIGLETNTLQSLILMDMTFQFFQPSISLEIFTNPQSYTLEQWVENFESSPLADPKVNLVRIMNDTTLGGQPAKKLSIFTFDIFGSSVGIVAIYQDYVYLIRHVDTSFHKQNLDYWRNLEQTIQKILSTFKFLDQKNFAIDSRSCLKDGVCSLLVCSGCFNKEWVKTAPSDLPCLTYVGYSCQCTNSRCAAVK